jgi:uncharacterized protein YkwD
MKSLVVAVVAAMVMTTTSAVSFAEVTTPKIRAKARRNGDVRVTCYGSRGVGSRDLTTMEFERAEDGVSFDPLTTIEFPKRSQPYDDTPGAAGDYSYRCRVVSDTGTSGWSEPADVTAKTPPTPRPERTGQPIPEPTSTPAEQPAEPTRTATPKPTATPRPTATATPAPPVDPGDAEPPLASGQHECRAGVLDDVLTLVNQARHDAGRAPYSAHPQLMWSSRRHSITMAQNQTLTHDGWVDDIRASGYTGGWLAENIAVGYPDPASVMQAWMGSTGHRTNILSATYRDIGIGCVVDQNGAIWWTQDFGA